MIDEGESSLSSFEDTCVDNNNLAELEYSVTGISLF